MLEVQKRIPFICPIGGIELLSFNSVSKEFQEYATRSSDFALLNEGHRQVWSTGAIKVLAGRKFNGLSTVKLFINPSKGGFSLKQVLDWTKFITGSQHGLVKSVDYQIDLKVSIEEHRIWTQLFHDGRKIKLYIYDKTAENKTNDPWTRIVFRRRFDLSEQVELSDFMAGLYTENPFNKVYLITADEKILAGKLNSYNKTIVEKSFVQSIKGLTSNRQKTVLNALDAEGYLWSLGPDYQLQLKYWLKAGTGTNFTKRNGWSYDYTRNQIGSRPTGISTKRALLWY